MGVASLKSELIIFYVYFIKDLQSSGHDDTSQLFYSGNRKMQLDKRPALHCGCWIKDQRNAWISLKCKYLDSKEKIWKRCTGNQLILIPKETGHWTGKMVGQSGKSACCQGWGLTFTPRNPRGGRRELTPTSCPLPCRPILWQVWLSPNHSKHMLKQKGNRSLTL